MGTPRVPDAARFPRTSAADRAGRGSRVALGGLLLNGALAGLKLTAGLAGNSYALVADAVESLSDVLSSAIVLSGLRLSTRAPDARFHFGYDKAQSVATALVGLALLAAATGIAWQASREMQVPHPAPAPFTLGVLAGVIVFKEGAYRIARRAGLTLDLQVIHADAWHHRSDAITSAAAFVGISAALVGGGRWVVADEVAALFASAILAVNGVRILYGAIGELMDQAPGLSIVSRSEGAARQVPGVLAIEKLRVRRAGGRCLADLHVQADPALTLAEAHVLSGRVKGAIREAVPEIEEVLVHMEPFEP